MLDSSITHGLRRIRTSEFGVFNRIVDGEINADIVVTGSSRAVNHYDPRILTAATGRSVWNIGINGSQTDMQLAVLKTYLQHNKAPSLIIHNLDSFAFVTSHQGIAFPDWYVPYLDQEPIYRMLVNLDSSWRKARYLPLYGYAVIDMRFSWMTGLAAVFGRQPPEDRFNGFLPRNDRWNEDFAKYQRANQQGVRFDLEPVAISEFDELLSTVSGHHTRVLLVYSPVYYEMQALERNREELFEHFRSAAVKHGATLWDFSASDVARQRDYFYNSQHLNADGAKRFSAELAERLATSGLIGSALPAADGTN